MVETNATRVNVSRQGCQNEAECDAGLLAFEATTYVRSVDGVKAVAYEKTEGS